MSGPNETGDRDDADMSPPRGLDLEGDILEQTLEAEGFSSPERQVIYGLLALKGIGGLSARAHVEFQEPFISYRERFIQLQTQSNRAIRELAYAAGIEPARFEEIHAWVLANETRN